MSGGSAPLMMTLNVATCLTTLRKPWTRSEVKSKRSKHRRRAAEEDLSVRKRSLLLRSWHQTLRSKRWRRNWLKMRATLTESVQLMGQREMNTNIGIRATNSACQRAQRGTPYRSREHAEWHHSIQGSYPKEPRGLREFCGWGSRARIGRRRSASGSWPCGGELRLMMNRTTVWCCNDRILGLLGIFTLSLTIVLICCGWFT